MATPPPILLNGNPLEVITFTFGGRTSRATRRGFAHLWHLQDELTKRRPDAWVRMIQPAFNTGVPQSAGTHDEADVWDLEIVGWDNWYAESRFIRDCGFASWVRDPTQGDFGWHHHSIAPGLPLDRYGDLVPAQMDDYRRHALGLKGQHDSGDDPQCFNNSGALAHTIRRFDYPTWKDDNMPLTDQEIAAIAQKATDKLLDSELNLSDGTTVTVSTALRRAAQMPSNLDNARAAINELIAATGKNTNSKVVNARSALMAKLDEIDDQVGP